MTHHFTTSADAIEQAITQPLEASDAVHEAQAEYNVQAIFDECFTFDVDEQAFIQHASTDEFWESVERHAR